MATASIAGHGRVLAFLLLAPALLAACALEPETTRQRNREELGLGAPRTASVRVIGELALDGGAVAACGPIAGTEHASFRVRLLPAAAPGTEIAVVVPDFHGVGDYRGALTVRRVAAGGGLVESSGEAEVRLADAAVEAGAHAAAGSFTGTFAGAAGGGEVTADFARCSYFG